MTGFKQRNNNYSNYVLITLAAFWKREGRRAWKWGDQWRGQEEFQEKGVGPWTSVEAGSWVHLKSSYCISGQCTVSEYTCGNLEGTLLLPPLLFLLILLILAIGISYIIWHCWYLKFTFHTPYEIVGQIVGKNSCPIISVNYVSKNIAKTIFWGKPYYISSLQIRAVKHIEVRFCTSSCSQEVTDLDHKPRLLVCDLN